MIKRLLIALAVLCAPVLAEQVAINQCGYLNNNDSSLIIAPTEASDLLNVDCSQSGKSIKKRQGYGIYKSLNTGQALHGVYHFFNSSGNDVIVAGSSTSLYGITSDGTPVQLISSATLNTTWDCTDTQGNAYCVTSNRDTYLLTDGATKTWYSPVLGTMITSTPDRNVVAGVSGSANTLYFSGSGAFTNYTTGINPTDPFTEVLGAPGSKITHERWGCNKLLWWKDQSFGYINGDNQTNIDIKIVSDNIGTFDNTSAQDPGGNIWFRGQDGHIYRYDCSSLEKMSVDISSNIAASGKRTSDYWTQTSQSDFQTGASSPTQALSFTISAGDIQPSSFTTTENSSTQWGSGTASNMTVGTSSISLATNNSGTASNPSFESALAGTWTDSSGGGSFSRVSSISGDCTITPQSGSFFAQYTTGANNVSVSGSFQVVDLSGNILATTTFFPDVGENDCVWRQKTATVSNSDLGKRVKFRLNRYTSTTEVLTTNDSYILGGSPSVYTTGTSKLNPTNRQYWIAWDNIANGSSTITSGSFTSQAIYTSLPYAYVFSSATWNANTSSPTFTLQKSANGSSGWTDVVVGTNTNSQINLPYIRYVLNQSIGTADNAQTAITGINFIARSSGTYYSAVHNAPTLSAWDTFNATYSNGDGGHNFFVRSSGLNFAILASSPSWGPQTVGAVVSTGTGSFFQVIDSFTITSATGTPPSLSDFTVNWFDGSASDQAYSQFFDNSVWFSVASGAGATTNNYIFKCDLIHLATNENDSCWTLYNFGANGMTLENNSLYFGSTAASNLFKFGDGVTSDSGTAITSFWKSKDLAGSDPWVANNLTQIDSYWTRNQGQSATVTYSLDTSTSTTSYTIALSSGTQSLIRNAKLVPSGKNFNVINFQIGDSSSSSQWEFLGLRAIFAPTGYRPTQ